MSLEKRTWVYVLEPFMYEIPGCKCGCPEKAQWSEYKDRLWCPCCERDFEPEYWGVFDGPINFEMSQLLGICFDRINLVTDKYEVCELTNDGIEYRPIEDCEIKAHTEAFIKRSDDWMKQSGLEWSNTVSQPKGNLGAPSKSDGAS